MTGTFHRQPRDHRRVLMVAGERREPFPFVTAGLLLVVFALVQNGCSREACTNAILIPCWIIGITLAIAILVGAIAVLREVTVAVIAGAMFLIFGFGGLAAAGAAITFPAWVGQKIADSVCGTAPSEPVEAKKHLRLGPEQGASQLEASRGDEQDVPDDDVPGPDSVEESSTQGATATSETGIDRSWRNGALQDPPAVERSPIDRTWTKPSEPAPESAGGDMR